MEMNGIGGSHNLSLQERALPTGEKCKVELTATTLFPEDEVKEVEESQARYKKYAQILNKMVTGKRLTAEEMRFLRQYYPEAAAKAERIQQEIKMLEAQFRACDTVEETDQLYEKVKTEALIRFAQKDSTGMALLPVAKRMHTACKAQREQSGTGKEEENETVLVLRQPEQAFDIRILEKHQRGIDVKA